MVIYLSYNMKNLYFIRKIFRILGLTKILGHLYSSEKRFGKLMLETIKEGDSVWDVGANVGLYEEAILEKVGAGGCVYAFEPNPESVAVMKDRFGTSGRLKIVNVGLSDAISTMSLYLNSDPTSVTASLSPQHVDDSDHAKNVHLVDIITGDSFAEVNGAPKVIKIDVEGFEVEVLRGLSEVIAGGVVRSICIEVHFREMEKRGVLKQFWQQNNSIVDCGYTAQWVDPSHVIYKR